MLVTFRSTATETITMFENVAVDLLKLMGASGRVPGALDPDEVPLALRRLETAIDQMEITRHAETPARPANNEDSTDEEEDEHREPPVALATRAVPLISLLKRAAAAKAEVMWEGK